MARCNKSQFEARQLLVVIYMLMVKSQTRGWKSQPGKAIPIISIGLDFYTSPIFVTPPQFLLHLPNFFTHPQSFYTYLILTSVQFLLHLQNFCYTSVASVGLDLFHLPASTDSLFVLVGPLSLSQEANGEYTGKVMSHILTHWRYDLLRSKAKSQNIRAKSKNICWSYSHILASIFQSLTFNEGKSQTYTTKSQK